jgi:toxin FitB
LSADSKRKGRPLAVINGLLAATAIEHNLTIVSRHSADFAHLPVNLVNPWHA